MAARTGVTQYAPTLPRISSANAQFVGSRAVMSRVIQDSTELLQRPRKFAVHITAS